MKGSPGFCAKATKKSEKYLYGGDETKVVSWGTVASSIKGDCFSKSSPFICLEIP